MDVKPPIPVEDELHHEYYMQWVGMSGGKDNWKTEELLQSMWNTIANEIRPDILVVNMGLHWLHFYGLVRDTGPQAIVRWVHDETWLQQVLDRARDELGIKVLLFKTTNLVCDDKFNGPYSQAVKRYNALDDKTLAVCRNSVRAAFSQPDVHQHITDLQIANYCANGTLSNHGSDHLNQRLRHFVDDLEEQPGMYVGVFNDHDVQHCNYTKEGDGRHYHTLNLLRIRLLANYLQCASAST